jgi:hypothetical protein
MMTVINVKMTMQLQMLLIDEENSQMKKTKIILLATVTLFGGHGKLSWLT